MLKKEKEEDEEKTRVKLTVEVEKEVFLKTVSGASVKSEIYKLAIKNKSECSAYNIEIVEFPEDVGYFEDMIEKFPYEELKAGEYVKVYLAMDRRTPQNFTITLKWEDVNKVENQELFTVNW